MRNVNVSGRSPDPRSECDIRVNPHDPTKLVAAVNDHFTNTLRYMYGLELNWEGQQPYTDYTKKQLTGQNGIVQARAFTEAVDVTCIVLTKLDGTAKGGIVIAVQQELGIPVKLVGVGESVEDLEPFDPASFVDALVG